MLPQRVAFLVSLQIQSIHTLFLFDRTWTKTSFNVQILCLQHMPICSTVYVASLAGILSIHQSHGYLFSSLLQTCWVFLAFDKCQHFPHETPTSHLREGTVKSPDYTITLQFGQVGTRGRGWGPAAKTNWIDCVIDLLGAGLCPCAHILVFTQRYRSCTRERITKSNIWVNNDCPLEILFSSCPPSLQQVSWVWCDICMRAFFFVCWVKKEQIFLLSLVFIKFCYHSSPVLNGLKPSPALLADDH